MDTIFVRRLGETEPEGPYSMAQLESLAASNQVKPVDEISEDGESDWQAISQIPGLEEKLFPKKIRLGLKKQKPPPPPPPGTTEGLAGAASIPSAPVTPPPAKEDDLARILRDEVAAKQAESDPSFMTDPLPHFGPLAGVAMILAAMTLLQPQWGRFFDAFAQPTLFWHHPTLLVGAFDLLAGIFLLVGATSFLRYVLIRMLVMAGAVLIYWWTGAPFDHGFFTVLAAIGAVLLVGTRLGITQLIGAILLILPLGLILLGGGYDFSHDVAIPTTVQE